MNHAKILASIAMASILLTGYASAGTANSTQEDYNTAVADAKKSLKTAGKANYEWRDSGKILKQADKAAKAGDFTGATKLANKAKRQGDLALEQSKLYADAGPPR